jgi:hypothetical protein
MKPTTTTEKAPSKNNTATMMMRLLLLIAAASSTAGFAVRSVGCGVATRLEASSTKDHDDAVSSRREALGRALGALAASTAFVMGPAADAMAASNPALETFKGKVKGQSFYPVRVVWVLGVQQVRGNDRSRPSCLLVWLGWFRRRGCFTTLQLCLTRSLQLPILVHTPSAYLRFSFLPFRTMMLRRARECETTRASTGWFRRQTRPSKR